MRYLNESPYGKKFGFSDISDIVAHYKRRMNLEVRIIKEIMEGYSIILPAKIYDINDVINKMEE